MTRTEPVSSTIPAGERRPLVIGLTGGIGSGKSTVADLFRDWGIPVLDTDQVARELVRPGQPALAEIHALFGDRCLRPDGSLDRAWLREQVFSSSGARLRLEAILHPLIRQRVRSWLETVDAPYCIVVMPLLVETAQQDLFDRIVVVDSPENEQLIRVAARDGLSDNDIMNIMATQADRATRLAAADDIISNDADIETLAARTRAVRDRLSELT